MENRIIYTENSQATSQEINMMMYLELGDLSGQKGNTDSALDYYLKGLQAAKELNDKSRIQQFSNLILTYI